MEEKGKGVQGKSKERGFVGEKRGKIGEKGAKKEKKLEKREKRGSEELRVTWVNSLVFDLVTSWLLYDLSEGDPSAYKKKGEMEEIVGEVEVKKILRSWNWRKMAL